MFLSIESGNTYLPKKNLKTANTTFGINLLGKKNFVKTNSGDYIETLYVLETALQRRCPSCLRPNPNNRLGWHVLYEKLTGLRTKSYAELSRTVNNSVIELEKKYPFIAKIKSNFYKDNMDYLVRSIKFSNKSIDNNIQYIRWWQKQLESVPKKILIGNQIHYDESAMANLLKIMRNKGR